MPVTSVSYTNAMPPGSSNPSKTLKEQLEVRVIYSLILIIGWVFLLCAYNKNMYLVQGLVLVWYIIVILSNRIL